MHLGQALDSGGSDHIAGQRDTGSAYAWQRMRDPIPVTTANGDVYATWECTVPTRVGPMRCYYLDNGGPDQSLISVDKLCREGEYTYIYTKWGAHLIDPAGNLIHLIADGGLQYLPAVTDDSHCDEKLAMQGQAQIQGYSTTVHRKQHIHTHKPARLGPCDNEGFREVMRGSTPKQHDAPRGCAHESRYTILRVDHEDTTDDLDAPMVRASDHMASPAAYAVQTRSQTKVGGGEPGFCPITASRNEHRADCETGYSRRSPSAS